MYVTRGSTYTCPPPLFPTVRSSRFSRMFTGGSRSTAPLFGMIGISGGVKKTSPAGCLPRRDVVQYPPSSLPSVNKGKHACHRTFSALFSLFALACASKPASQKPKITRKTIADRCEAVWPEQKCVQTRKGPQGILLPGGLTLYGRISARQNRVRPCQLMVRRHL